MTKSELRKTYLARRRELSDEERISGSDGIAKTFFSNFDLARVNYLHCFIPIAKFNEVETLRIIGRIWREFPSTTVVVPRVDFETNEMRSLTFSPDTEVVENSWGISEPAHDEFIDDELIDMVLVPGVCFDRRGHRIGYGKGFYDRFLSHCRADCVKIGLSYFEPVDKIDDVHEGDVEVDFVVTPTGVI